MSAVASPTISIVLTCYHEGELLRETAPRLCRFMDLTSLDYEVVIVVDGHDPPAERILQELTATETRLRLFVNAANTGRGGAVTRGIRESRGRIAGFIDPDLEIPPMVIPAMVAELDRGYDLIIARRVFLLRPSNALRWCFSKGYKALARLMLALPDVDTESGCKFFARDRLLPVLDEVRNTRWFWDTELVARAIRRGLRVGHVLTALERNWAHGTTVRVFTDIPEYLRELVRLRAEFRRAGTAPR